MRLIAVAVAVAVAVVAAPVHAASKEDQAIALYEKGERLYKKGKYVDALTTFRKAYKAEPAPGLLFNIAQCLRKLGKHGAAAQALERYLKDETDIPNRAEIESLLDEERKAAGIARTEPSLTTPTTTPPPTTTTPTTTTATTTTTPTPPTTTPPTTATSDSPLLATEPEPTPADTATTATTATTAPATADEGVSPIVWAAVGGGALVVLVGASVAAAVALSPPPVAPSGNLGLFDFR